MRPRSRVAPLALPVLAAIAVALCTASAARSQGKLDVTSVFADGGFIPVDYSCDGRGNSPPLQWSGVPPETKSIAVVVVDPDAPKGPFVHWVVYGIPPEARGLPLDAVARNALPLGAQEGKNTKGTTTWVPVCPPPPSVHHYHFKVFALGDRLTLNQATEGDLTQAMRGHVLAQGELVGRFGRQGH